MTESIFEEVKADLAREGQRVEHAAERVLSGVTDRFHHHGYHDRKPGFSVPEGTPMSLLDVIDDDAKEYLTDGVTYLEGMAAKLKAIAPGVISFGEAAGSQTVSAAVEALAGKVLPPDIDAWLAGFIKDAIAKFAAPAQAAQPAAPAEPAQAPTAA